MGKAIGFVIAAVEVGAGIFLSALGNPLGPILISAGISTAVSTTVNLLTAPGATRPETTEQDIKSPIPPRVYSVGERRFYGASICYKTASDGTTVDVWAYLDQRVDAVLQPYLNDDKVTVSSGTVQTMPDKRYQGGNVKADWNLGLATETAFAAVIAKLPGIWTSAHRGDGVVTGYLLKQQEKAKYFLETYPQGDQVTMSLAMRTAGLFDPRDPDQDVTDPDTWSWGPKWTDNAALGLVYYLLVHRGYDWGTQFLPQLDKLIAAANDCDAAEPLDAGGTEKRYRSCVSWKATDRPADVISAHLGTFDGWYCLNERNEVVIYSGRYYAPTVTLGADDIVAYRHQDFVEDENAVNEVTVQFVSAEHAYNTVDAESYRDEAAIAASGREPNVASLNAQIPSATQGRRLAKRQMARTNSPSRGNVTTNYAGRAVLGERYINLVLDEIGFSGPVEIVSPPERDAQTGGVTFDYIAIPPNLDDWDPAAEDGAPVPPGTVVPSDALPAPTVTSITPTYGQNTAYNTPGVKLTIEAIGPDLPGLTWYVRTRPTGGVSWIEQEYPDIDPGASVTLETGFLPLGELDVEVSYKSSDGRLSPWAALGDDPIDTGNVLPSPVTNLSVTANADASLIFADWDDSSFATSYLVEIIVE